MNIAMVTYKGKPGFSEDDAIVIPALQKIGIAVEAKPWNPDDLAWHSFDAVILRSCWDYHLNPAGFIDWLDKIEMLGCKVLNPVNIVKWNHHKGYLRELEDGKIKIPGTLFLQRGMTASLPAMFAAHSWQKAVIKPAISASGYLTMLTDVQTCGRDEQILNAQLQNRDMIVQEFMEEIKTGGEYSLIFFNRVFSHAVLKKVSGNEFRVQSAYNGTARPVKIQPNILEEVENIVHAVPGKLLYARVDGVISKDRFILMELELIEPTLYLMYDKDAPVKFAEAVAALII